MSSTEDHSAQPAELPRPSRRLFYLGLVAAFVSLILDQASKLAILALFDGRKISSGAGRVFDFSSVGADFVSEIDIMKSPR